MWETEMWRIIVPGNRAKNFETTSSWKKKVDVVTHFCHPSNIGKLKIESGSRLARVKSKIYLKNNQRKKNWMYDSSNSVPP
jgi:ribosomal protein L31